MKVVLVICLLTKFMQRGRDADIAAKLQEQHKKEVSEQQWHLSIIRETDSISSKTAVSYEPSYRAFETKSSHGPISVEGRRTFGSFVPDIDVCILYRLF